MTTNHIQAARAQAAQLLADADALEAGEQK